MPATPPPGHVMRGEMAEQPRVVDQLVDRASEVGALVGRVLPEPLAGIVLVARGSSDFAAVYARYLLEYVTGRPVALAAPSLYTRYQRRTAFDGWLAVGVSQSGQTPEIVDTVSFLRGCGARTLALTNVADSALADVADETLALQAGSERAVPATKTFTAQVAAFALIAEALGPVPWSDDDWPGVVAAMEQVLADPEPAASLASELGGRRLLSIGRGFLYAASLEAGLKLVETTGLQVAAYSPADLQHGPIAMAGPDVHAFTFLTPGPVADDMRDVAALLAERGVRVHPVAPAGSPTTGGGLEVPSGTPEALAPLVHVIRAQQLALELALVLGIDPDHPGGLSKVTATT